MKNFFLYLIYVFCFFNLSCINSEKKLIKEMKNGNYENIASFLRSNGNPNLIVEDESLLFYLIENNLDEQAIEAIKNGADVNWVYSSPDVTISVFDLVIQKNNICLEKEILNHKLKLDDYGLNYFDKITQLYVYKKIDKQFVNVFLSYDYIKEYLQPREKSLCILAWNWTKDTPEFYNKIYGEKFNHSLDIPVLIYTTAWGNIEGTKFFIDEGFSPFREYEDPVTHEKFNALEYAEYSKKMMMSHHGDPECLTENDEELKEQNKLIEYLRRLTE